MTKETTHMAIVSLIKVYAKKQAVLEAALASVREDLDDLEDVGTDTEVGLTLILEGLDAAQCELSDTLIYDNKVRSWVLAEIKKHNL